ncbi:MAG: permease [Oscillatoriales cyanobacterium SM2_1_8]|nr:permease [Oscillatoriales cyanobacterium SM2_1_8]
MAAISGTFTLFLSLLVEAIPFLLAGVLLSSALLLFVNEEKLVDRLPTQPFLGALAGGILGFLFPVCECGNVPVARRLIAKRAPMSVAVGFLLAAPTINPVVIWSTWIAFRDRPEIVFLRVAMSLAVAVILGCLFGLQKDMTPYLQPQVRATLFAAEEAARSPVPTGMFFLGDRQPLSTYLKPNRWRLFIENSLGELRELGGLLVLGSAIAAIVQIWLPRDLILTLGRGPISSVVAMLLLAGLVSICSTVDAFFALSFSSAFTSGSLLAFLVFGPTIDLKSVGLMLTVFNRRAVFYLFFLTAQLVFLGCVLVNLHWY